MMWESFQLHVA